MGSSCICLQDKVSHFVSSITQSKLFYFASLKTVLCHRFHHLFSRNLTLASAWISQEGNKATVLYFSGHVQPLKEPTLAQIPPSYIPIFILRKPILNSRSLGHKCHGYISQTNVFFHLKAQTRVLTWAWVWKEGKRHSRMQLIYFPPAHSAASVTD